MHPFVVSLSKEPFVVSLSRGPFVVSLSREPFVVSLSNHAFGGFADEHHHPTAREERGSTGSPRTRPYCFNFA